MTDNDYPDLRWTLTVAQAERVAELLAPLGLGCAIDGDRRPVSP